MAMVANYNNLPPIFRKQLNNIKYRGSTARVHFALKELPSIKGIQSDNMDSIFAIAPSMEYLERAYDCAKYGRISKNPYIEFSIPSIRNPEFAPEGKQVVSASVQYVPYHLRVEDWNVELKKKVSEIVISILEKYSPGITELIEHSEDLPGEPDVRAERARKGVPKDVPKGNPKGNPKGEPKGLPKRDAKRGARGIFINYYLPL